MLILGKDIEKLENNQNVIVIGNILDISDNEKYVDIRIDDNSNVFYVRFFKNEEKINLKIGDNVLIIGYINEFNERKKINVRKIRKLKEKEFLFWKIKSIKLNKYKEKIEKTEEKQKEEKKEVEKEENQKSIEEIDIENVLEDINIEDDLEIEKIDIEEIKENIDKEEEKDNNIENEKEYVLKLIKEYRTDLVPIEEIISNSKLGKEKTEEILKELIEEGEIYEPKIGFVKILEI